MLSCKEISELASDHIDNKLSPMMKIKVKMHLLMCHKCRNFVKQLRATVNTLKNLTPPVPNDEFVDKQATMLANIAKSLKPDQPDNKDC